MLVSFAVRQVKAIVQPALIHVFPTSPLQFRVTSGVLFAKKVSLINKFNMSHNCNTNYSTSAKPTPNISADNIIWVDMEMTGLDPEKDHVLEVACLVTDGQLNILDEGPDICIYQPPQVLNNMNDWSTKQHAKSGLKSQCETSRISLKEAERELLQFVKKWTPFNECPLGGNTIYMDRLFLMKHMPEFEKHMHYRIIDVSSVKELCRRWYPDIYNKQPNKKENSKHRAISDIKSSIDELKFYKENIFHKPQMGVTTGLC